MDNTPLRVPSTTSPTVYWRRRVVALGGGIALLALFAWAVNGSLSSGAAAGQATSGHHAHSSYHGHSLAGAPPSGSPGPGGQLAQASTAAHRQSPAAHSPSPPQPAASPVGSAPARHHSAATPEAGATASPRPTHQGTHWVAACSLRDIVLRLFTLHYWYEKHEHPEFAVAVMSTASRPCKFNMGAKSVSVRITGPHGRTWDSADCVRGHMWRETVLAKEVPAVAWFSWGRKESSPGCHFSRRYVHAGTYMATAVAGYRHSKPTVIVLAARGVAVP